MKRRYNRWHSRLDQPDPSDGSYDLTDPQSLNRYAYTRGDPVNFTDPTGLDIMSNPPWRDSNPGFIPASQNGWSQLVVYNQFQFHNETMRATIYEFWSPRSEGSLRPDFYPIVFPQFSQGRKFRRLTPEEEARIQKQYDECVERVRRELERDQATLDKEPQKSPGERALDVLGFGGLWGGGGVAVRSNQGWLGNVKSVRNAAVDGLAGSIYYHGVWKGGPLLLGGTYNLGRAALRNINCGIKNNPYPYFHNSPR